MLTRIACAFAIALALAAPAAAADFTQPERDPKFIQSARRQDKELLHFYGRLIPGGYSFNHLGGYQVVVHRAGLARPVILVPVNSLPFADEDSLRKAARTGDVVVGVLKINFGMHDPEIMPGNLLLVYDGLRVHLRNVHGEDISSFESTIGPAGKTAAVEGAVNAKGSSLAEITRDSMLRLNLQLAPGGSPAARAASKVQLEFCIPGLVDDDDSPKLELAKPAEKTAPARSRN